MLNVVEEVVDERGAIELKTRDFRRASFAHNAHKISGSSGDDNNGTVRRLPGGFDFIFLI